MTVFRTVDLYGGAITLELPQDYLDASDIRQIPSHQELFLSSTTLTSIIVELNSRISEPNDTAARSHFNDPVETPDSGRVITCDPCTLGSSTLAQYPTCLVVGEITSYERHAPAATKIKSWLLLVRIEDKTTDMCIRINMPLKEHDQDGAWKEEALVNEAMDKIRRTLTVKDFALFVD